MRLHEQITAKMAESSFISWRSGKRIWSLHAISQAGFRL